jgi:MOSC domain-containing protein YiiM
MAVIWAHDATNYTDIDAMRTLDALGEMWHRLMNDLEPPILSAGAPSVRHCASESVAALNSLLDEPVSDMAPPAQQVGLAAAAVVAVFRATAGANRHRIDPVLTQCMVNLHVAGRAVVDARAGAPHQVGELVQISSSDGGVPKTAVDRAHVAVAGLEGDRQRTRLHHGRPWQALCLWSADVIDALASDGHPIGYGSAGENLTVRAITWSSIRPGTQLTIGEVRCEISTHADPCKQNARWFSDLNFMRIAPTEPGMSRMYASVLVPGVVNVGDQVVVEAP